MHRVGVVFGLFRRDLIDQLVNRADDGVERVFISGQQHPAGQGRRTFTVERVERQIHHFARRAQPRTARMHRLDNRFANGLCKMLGERLLQS